ncbi:MAG: anti-sigma factor [Chitinophagaceae bacterium]
MDIQEYIQSGVIETYVLGIASTEEIAELQRLRRQYPAIETAIAQKEQWLNDLANTDAAPLPGTVKNNLLNTLKNEFTAPVITMDTAPTRKTGRTLKYVAAASVILLVGSFGMNIYMYSKYRKAVSDYTALQNEHNTLLTENKVQQAKYGSLYHSLQLMTDTAMLKVSMPGIKGKEGTLATLYWNTRSKDVYVFANNLPQAPTGKQYQLWALVDGKPVDAGMLTDCGNDICKLKTILRAQAFAITLEKEGGSPTPDLNAMYVLGTVKS